MRMDPGIILAGQQPDFVNTLARSTQAASMQNDAQQQNRIHSLFQRQGGDIMAGDENALRAYAQFDPQAALGVKQAQQGMAFDAEKMEMARSEAKRLAEAQAFKMDQASLAQAKERLGGLLQAGALFYEKGDRAGYQAFIQQNGLDPAQYPFDMLPANLAKVQGTLDGLEAAAEYTRGPKDPDSIRALRIRAAEAGLEQGTPEYEQFMASGGKKQDSRVIMGPDGQPILMEGDAASNPKFTEGQSKDNVYSTRARGALEVLEGEVPGGGRVADALISRGERVAGAIPLGLGREFQSDDFQVAEQAGLEFLQAILRKDTGAAITQDEVESYGRTYLPQPGDSEKVLATKRQARIRAINALESGMSAQQMLARDRALIRSAEEGGQAQNAQDFSSMGAAELARVDVMSLSEEELDAFEAAMQAVRGGQ